MTRILTPLLPLLLAGFIFTGCGIKPNQKTGTSASISKIPFGVTKDGIAIDKYTVSNKNGMKMSVINYGGIITSLLAPDKNGVFEDMVLGFDSLSQYEKGSPFFGALVGRFGNRIANGQFTLDGKTYTLAKNNGQNHLHGGVKGFDKVVWTISEFPSKEGKALKLTYLSKDMEEGYPGNLNVEVMYTLTDANELKISYRATTDKKTVLNLSQHSYFNLSGNVKQNVLDHLLTLNADQFLPVERSIPTGELRKVEGTPFDFRNPTPIGSRIGDTDEQLKAGSGYDHCWVLNRTGQSGLQKAATVYEPVSGRLLEVTTTEPAIQFYSANFLNATGKGGIKYGRRSGLCLETQHYPDSPNQKSFPSVELSPGEIFQSQTVFKFSVR